MPVVWRETKVDRTPIGRTMSDIILHGSGMLHLRARLDGGVPSPPKVSPVSIPTPVVPSQAKS